MLIILSIILKRALTPKVSKVFLVHNLIFNRLCKLEILLDDFEILHYGEGQSYLSKKINFT